MAWRIDPSAGRRLRAAIATSEGMRSDIGVHGARLNPAAFAAFWRGALLLGDEDVADAEAVCAALSRDVGLACEVPDAIAALNAVDAHEAGMSLARHMGVDPVRLAMCAFDAKARVTDGPRAVEANIRRAFGREAERGAVDELSVRITLSHGVTWHGHRLTARANALPASVVQSLAGRTMRTVTDHPWPGWDRIGIVSAARRGNSLVVDTDAIARVPAIRASEAFEDGAKRL